MMRKMAKRMLSKNFGRIRFSYTDLDPERFGSRVFGIYIHVPFCTKLCSFCPFYKVLLDNGQKERYLGAIEKEFGMRNLGGKANWLYMGGGTPNLLTADEVTGLLDCIRERVGLSDAGMEGVPDLFTEDYIHAIADAGINKISVGVESMASKTLDAVNRAGNRNGRLREIVKAAEENDVNVNFDLMIGLPGQGTDDFISDISVVAEIGPGQITTYPFMQISGVRAVPSMGSEQMFEAIEVAGDMLSESGYHRDSIWIFSNNGGKVYDSSQDELVGDYLGFGPGAFSTVGTTQIVNPGIEAYLDSIENGRWSGFRAEVNEDAAHWRKFARELYKLDFDQTSVDELPGKIRKIMSLLRTSGHIDKDGVTPKGRFFVHDITKTVVERLPFPLSNPSVVDNWAEYERAKASAE
jgi:oxygen-independent coproporphyrinogen-3 oxidase